MTTSFILVGKPASGKKSLLNRLHGKDFTQSYFELLDSNTARGVRVSRNHQTYTLQFEGHNFAGRFESITDNQGKFCGNKKALICIDVLKCLQEARDIIIELLNRLKRTSNCGGAPILVFTKCDSADRILSNDDINTLQSEYELEVIHTDASRLNVATEFFIDLFEKANIAKEQFIAEHRNLYNQSRAVCFLGFFRRSRVDYSSSLGDIIRHAQLNNNRSRQAFINLGWMQHDGSIIASSAPDEVKEAALSTSSTAPLLLNPLS